MVNKYGVTQMFNISMPANSRFQYNNLPIPKSELIPNLCFDFQLVDLTTNTLICPPHVNVNENQANFLYRAISRSYKSLNVFPTALPEINHPDHFFFVPLTSNIELRVRTTHPSFNNVPLPPVNPYVPS